MTEPQATGRPDTAEPATPLSPEADTSEITGVVVGRPEGALPINARDPRDELPEHLNALRAFAISLTRNVAAADDLVQDTIVKAWTNLDKFQPGSNLRAWLFTILRNTFYSDKRKTRREVPDPEGLYAATLAEKPSHDGRLALADFRRAFDRLSPEHREVLILVGASGFAYEEASVMMGVAVGRAAALCIARDATPREIYTNHLQEAKTLWRLPGNERFDDIDALQRFLSGAAATR